MKKASKHYFVRRTFNTSWKDADIHPYRDYLSDKYTTSILDSNISGLQSVTRYLKAFNKRIKDIHIDFLNDQCFEKYLNPVSLSCLYESHAIQDCVSEYQEIIDLQKQLKEKKDARSYLRLKQKIAQLKSMLLRCEHGLKKEISLIRAKVKAFKILFNRVVTRQLYRNCYSTYYYDTSNDDEDDITILMKLYLEKSSSFILEFHEKPTKGAFYTNPG